MFFDGFIRVYLHVFKFSSNRGFGIGNLSTINYLQPRYFSNILRNCILEDLVQVLFSDNTPILSSSAVNVF